MDDEDPFHLIFGPDTVTRDTMRLNRINLELERLQKEHYSLAKQLFTEERRRRSDKECVQLQLISLAEQMDDMEAELGGDEYLSESMGDFTSEAKDGWTSNGTSKFEKQNFVEIFKKHPLIVTDVYSSHIQQWGGGDSGTFGEELWENRFTPLFGHF